MANLPELDEYTAGVFQVEEDTVWLGGVAGPANNQGKALANRTKWLKAQLEALATGKQPLDATLTALAALATVADKLIYATAEDTFDTATLTAFARTLLDDADAATARATLGAASPADVAAAIAALVNSSPATLDTLKELADALGDDPNFAATTAAALGGKQPLDATLTALAALATVADKLIYATAEDTFDTATLTAFARTLLDDADAATMRATLGMGGAGTAGTVLVGTGAGYVEVPDDHEPLTINGSFEINQRGAVSVADDTYCLDRFYILTETGNVTVAQITNPEAGAPWGIRLTQPDAVAKRMGLATIIESKDCRKLRSAVAALAARVKLSTGGTLRYAILEHAGTADTVTSDVVNNWASAAFTATNFFIAGLNVLQCGTITPGAATYGDLAGYGAVGAGMNNLIAFVWTEAAAAQNVTLDINRLRCVPGVVALPHRFRANELGLCERYFDKSFPLAAAPAQNTGSTLGAFFFMAAVANTNYNSLPFRTRKRVPPTFVTYNPNAVNANVRDISAGADRTVNVGTPNEVSVPVGALGCVATNSHYVHWTADAEL